ncbi:MAG TPA: hypothetical protein PKD67_04000 [Ignavibacteriaceae bacterium]|nr:hypothetical protein [Ignavibacteriaceae bacterium]
MTNDEKFSRYFFNEMNLEEIKEFEKELSIFPELNNDFENFKKVMNLFTETKAVELDAGYTQSILPRFRNKIESKRKKSVYIKYGYAFAVLFLAVISYLIIARMMTDKPEMQKIYSGLTDDDANYLASELDLSLENDYDENSFAKIDSLYNKTLSENITESINDNNIGSVSKDINLNEIEKYLTDKDVETLYAELSNKEILKR